jgi:hypothetical protein
VTGKPEGAAQLFGAMESLLESISTVRATDSTDQREYDHYAAAVRAQLDEETFVNAWQLGRVMTLEQAIAYALEEANS